MTLNAAPTFVAATGTNEPKNPNYPHFSPPQLGLELSNPRPSQPPQGSPIAKSPWLAKGPALSHPFLR
jgi:hypothetical protein